MKKVLSLLCLLALLLMAALPASAAVDIPSPPEDFYVLDEANVLENETEGLIVFTNDLLKKACGAEVVVVAVESTNGTAIDDYVYELLNDWGVGDAKKQNGFVLLLATKDDNYYALQGTGLSDDFTDGEVKVLLNKYLEPDFAKKDYDAGVNKVFAQIVSEISGIYSAGVSVADGQEALEAYLTEEDAAEYAANNASTANNRSQTTSGYSAPVRTGNSGGGSGILGFIIVIALVVIIIALVTRSRRRARRYTNTTTYDPNTYGGTTYSGSSNGSYGRGFLGGYLLGRRRPTAPPPPPVQPVQPPVNMGGVRPVTRPTQPTQPVSRPTQPASRPTTPRSSSSTSSIGSSFARSVSRGLGSFTSGRSGGAGRSSGGSRTGGFGGGRSGGGGGSRGGGAGRGR